MNSHSNIICIILLYNVCYVIANNIGMREENISYPQLAETHVKKDTEPMHSHKNHQLDDIPVSTQQSITLNKGIRKKELIQNDDIETSLKYQQSHEISLVTGRKSLSPSEKHSHHTKDKSKNGNVSENFINPDNPISEVQSESALHHPQLISGQSEIKPNNGATNRDFVTHTMYHREDSKPNHTIVLSKASGHGDLLQKSKTSICKHGGHNSHIMSHSNTMSLNPKPCSKSAEACEFWLQISEKLTMMYSMNLVRPVNGSLHLYDADNDMICQDALPKDETKKIIQGDGYWENPRLAITINGTIPGPTISVYEGQRIIVHVKNMLKTQVSSIHWHGMFQTGTPFMDGMAHITQCPIGPGESYDYSFKPSRHGTFFYHSHSGVQREAGVYGALIVKEKESPYNNVEDEFILQLADWNHMWDSDTGFMKMMHGPFLDGKTIRGLKSLDGAYYSMYALQSALINGKGRLWYNSSSHNNAPLETFYVKPHKTYRMRLIHTGSLYPFLFRINGHNLQAISSDGHDIEPVVVNSLILHPGERYDILIETHSSIGKQFLIEGLILGEKSWNIIKAEAILSYEADHSNMLHHQMGDHVAMSHSKMKEVSEKHFMMKRRKRSMTSNGHKFHHAMPTHSKVTKGDSNFEIDSGFGECGLSHNPDCLILGCHFLKFPKDYHASNRRFKCINLAKEVQASKREMSSAYPLLSTKPAQTHFFSFGFPSAHSGTINGYQFKMPTVSFYHQLHYPEIFNDKLWDENCHCIPKLEKYCKCIHTETLPFNKTIDFVFLNMGKGRGPAAHPVHLHGHTLLITHVGYPSYNSEGKFFKDNEDIICHDPYCYNVSFDPAKYPPHSVKPVYKDTITVPIGGYAVGRFTSNNPGPWFMHCHALPHSDDGMAMIINEAPDHQARIPGPIKCGAVSIDSSAPPPPKMNDDSNEHSHRSYMSELDVKVEKIYPRGSYNSFTFWFVVSVLTLLCIVQFLWIVRLMRKQRSVKKLAAHYLLGPMHVRFARKPRNDSTQMVYMGRTKNKVDNSPLKTTECHIDDERVSKNVGHMSDNIHGESKLDKEKTANSVPSNATENLCLSNFSSTSGLASGFEDNIDDEFRTADNTEFSAQSIHLLDAKKHRMGCEEMKSF